jgi:hypothetical protein
MDWTAVVRFWGRREVHKSPSIADVKNVDEKQYL